jgi:hypothetical protein
MFGLNKPDFYTLLLATTNRLLRYLVKNYGCYNFSWYGISVILRVILSRIYWSISKLLHLSFELSSESPDYESEYY